MFTQLFELLTVASDISEFVSLKKTFDNHEQLQIINKLDKIDDEVFSCLMVNQKIIIKLLGELCIMIKKMMKKIIENDNKEDMERLGDIFVNMVYDLKDKDNTRYNDIKFEMYKMAYGEHLNESIATEWVSHMENKDGTVGEHWTYEQTEQVRKQYAPDLNGCDFYAILNSVYSDYFNSKLSTEDYINLAKDFINDKDAPKDKVLRYYMFIIK